MTESDPATVPETGAPAAGACTLRPFEPADGAALRDLHRRAILASPPEAYGAEERESWAAGLTAEGYAVATAGGERIEVALAPDGAPVGFCGWRTGFGAAPEDAEIVGLYVAPERQGSGIGRRLLDSAEAALRAAGARRAVATVSLPAEGFYARAGYRVLATGFYRTRGGVEIAVRRMAKTLA